MAEQTVSTERPLRADARRNRDRVLAAARAAFAQDGADVQMEAIAKRAGVGVGTIYRHFPTKQALIDELIRRSVTESAANVTLALNHLDPWQALTMFVHRCAEVMARDRGLREVYGDLGLHLRNGSEPGFQAFWANVAELVRRARVAGHLRDGIGVDEFSALMCGLAMSIHRCCEPRLFADVLLQGLRPPPS